MIPRTRRLLDAAHDGGVPVFYVNDSHIRKDFEMYPWGEHAMRGTRGARIVCQLRPRKKVIRIPEQAYSSFYGTRLERELKNTCEEKGANTLVLSGLYADCCVRHPCADGFFRGYETLVAKDAVEFSTELAFSTGLEYLKYWYLTDLMPTRES
jgi:nicotinamidase-related amidase